MVKGAVGHRFAAFQQEFGLKEPGLSITAAPAAQAPTACLAPAAAQRLVDMLLTLPHGVVKNSHAVAGGRRRGWRVVVVGCCTREAGSAGGLA